ncbi:MAG: MFS transporter [Crocinitomicaceae bacterium]|nr:MFS transporter [Crocinitomicaceae bacterium]
MTKQDTIYTLQFWLLCASSVLFMASFNMILAELPHYLDSIGGQDYKGLIIGLFAIAALLSRPFSGKLADTIGRIPVMIIGPVVCIVLGVLYPLTTTISGFLLLRFFHGFSTGFKPTGTTAYLADIVPASKRGEAMGILGVAGSIGMAAGPAMGSFIATSYSLNLMFWMSSVVAGMSILVLMGMKETLPSTVKFNPNLLLIHPRDVIEYDVWLPSLVMLLTVYSFGTILTVTPDFSDYLGISNRGIFFSIMLSASIAVRLVSGKASDRLGRANVLLFGTLCLALAMVILGLTDSKFWFYIGATVFGIAAGVNSPTIFAWTADLANVNSRGKAMSTMFIALEAGIVLGSVLGAFFYDNQIEQLKYAYWFGGLLALVAFLVVLIRKLKT